MTSPGIPHRPAVFHDRFRETARNRFSTLIAKIRVMAGTSGSWARQHQNWFWLALAALLGLTYLYFLFAAQSPMWH